MGRRVGRFVLVCALVALVVVGITLHNAAQLRQSELAALMKEAEAAGYPLDPTAIEASYNAGKPEPNAADHYVEAFALLERGEGPAALEKAIEAAEIGRARYPLRFRHEAPIPFELSLTRELSLDFSAAIREAIEQGDETRTHTLLTAHLALGESMNEAPLLILQAVRSATLSRVLNDLQAVFAAGMATDALLRDMEQRLDDINFMPVMTDAIAVERAAAFSSALEQARRRPPLARAIDYAAGWQEALLGAILTSYARLLEAAQTPGAFRGAALQSLEVLPESMRGVESDTAAAIQVPTVRILDHASRTEALAAAAVAACRVERYRLSEGRLPETVADLAALGIALPGDPLASSPIHFARTETGYRTWSAGLDGINDGGADGSDDVVFAVESGE